MALKFLNGDRVRHTASEREGTVHHSYKFPEEPWKYVVDFPGGDQGSFTEEELERRS